MIDVPTLQKQHRPAAFNLTQRSYSIDTHFNWVAWEAQKLLLSLLLARLERIDTYDICIWIRRWPKSMSACGYIDVLASY